MTRPVALRVALDLARSPILAKIAARQPLPPDMLTVIKIAGGCPTTLAEAARATGEVPQQIREASASFLETVLFGDRDDSYRVLGADPAADQTVLRDHMRWLMKWLHPDRDRTDWQSMLALRVSAAWDDLKSPERRQAYDRARHMRQAAASRSNRRRERRMRIPWVSQSVVATRTPGQGLARWAIILAGMATIGIGLTMATSLPVRNASGGIAPDETATLAVE